MNKRYRIFIAINLPEKIKFRLAEYKEKWSRRSRGSSMVEPSGPELPARWTGKNNLHITLFFLGYINDEELVEVCKILKEVAQKHLSFFVNLIKICYGPISGVRPGSDLSLTPTTPRMVWAVGEKSQEFADLRDDLSKSLMSSDRVRFSPEKREFSPHITLARIRAFEWRGIEPEERPEVNEDINLSFEVNSIDIMESELKRGGPQYTIIQSEPLK